MRNFLWRISHPKRDRYGSERVNSASALNANYWEIPSSYYKKRSAFWSHSRILTNRNMSSKSAHMEMGYCLRHGNITTQLTTIVGPRNRWSFSEWSPNLALQSNTALICPRFLGYPLLVVEHKNSEPHDHRMFPLWHGHSLDSYEGHQFTSL